MATDLSDASSRRVDLAIRAILWLITAWLVATLYFVRIDFDDGYSTIVNSQYFLGISSDYFWQRGPLVAWLLVPAEFLANLLGLGALNVLPHHATMIAIHMAYLVGVWIMLKREFGARAHTLLAFIAAVPTFLFFSYAPFISHDLFPGAVALLMVMLASDQIERPTRRRWLILVALGTSVMLVKQTYALIWVAVGIACSVSLQLGENRGLKSIKPILNLASAALASAVLTWIAYSWVLRNSFGAHPLLLGPWLQFRGVLDYVQSGGDIAKIFNQWMYLRNLSAHGYLAVALALPGLFFCLRSGNIRRQSVAVAWLVLVTFMQLLEFKEVRYLGFLAPLTALLVVAALDAIIGFRRSYLWLVLLVLAVDVAGVTREAMRITSPYYSKEVSGFLDLFPAPDKLAGTLVMNAPLSFVSPEPYAFYTDRFHRITHVVPDQLRYLLGYDIAQMLLIYDQDLVDRPDVAPGSVFIYCNDVLTRRPPYRRDNQPQSIESFFQAFTVVESVTLLRVGDEYELRNSNRQPVMLLRVPGVKRSPILVSDRVAAADVDALRGIEDAPAQLELLGFRVKALCDVDGCRTLPE